MVAEPVRIACFVANFHRATGAQRSLLLLLRGLDRGRFAPLAVFPGEGVCTRLYREAGIEVVVEPAPPALEAFGGALLRAGLLARTRVAMEGHVYVYRGEVERHALSRAHEGLHPSRRLPIQGSRSARSPIH